MKEKILDNNYQFCIECINCKIKRNTLYCTKGKFVNKQLYNIIIMTSFDFNCGDYNGEINDSVIEGI